MRSLQRQKNERLRCQSYVTYNCILFHFMGVVVECEIALKSLLYEDFKSYYIHLIWKGALACASCNWSTRAVRLLWSHCVCLIYMLILRTRVTQWASETSFRHSCMPNRTFILWVPCVKRNCRVCFQFLQGIGCGGATQIKSHTFAVSERHDKLRLSYRVSVTASGPSAARVAEQAVNHDIIVDNVSQKHINESRSLLTKFYFI